MKRNVISNEALTRKKIIE